MSQNETDRIPLTILYTGNGKGKTTAAMGLVLRTLGHRKQCAVLQFIKSPDLKTGEKAFAQEHALLWENYGEGFLWNLEDEGATRDACRTGWQRAKELIETYQYELIVLDEFTYPLERGYVDVHEVISYLSKLAKDSRMPHLVITGRDAPEALIEAADMVHQIVEVKHPWRTAQVPAQICIEY